jgi:antitoxin component YwqK of YwqJK toxin-antitoxin module
MCMLVAAIASATIFVAQQESAPAVDAKTTRTEEVRDKSDNSLVLTRAYYADASGRHVLHGPQTEWFSNGKPRRRVEYRDGLRHGMSVEWDRDGCRVGQGRWENDSQAGQWTEWYFDGRKCSECTYNQGKIVGKKVFWPPSPMPNRVCGEDQYDNDGQLIEQTRWHANGQKSEHGTFRPMSTAELFGRLARGVLTKDSTVSDFEPRKHGKWTYWDKTGRVAAEGTWKDGKPYDGVCLLPGPHTTMGETEVFGRYKNGELIEKLPPPRGNRQDAPLK